MIKKKYLFFVVLATFILIASGLSSASILKKEVNSNFTKTENKRIFLGQATIYGDGIEENTIIDLSAENDLAIKINSQTETVDFYITYSMECIGITDTGAITLIIQINGAQKGINETVTLDEKQGDLIVENIEVKILDALSFQIGAAYTNINPPFVVSNITIGGGVISKNFIFWNELKQSNFLSRLIEIFPVVKKLISYKIISLQNII